MRFTMMLLGLVAPFTVQAAPVSEAMLEANFDRCVQQCGIDVAQDRCEQGCRCLTDAMARTWDAEEFQARAEVLETDPDNEQIVAEISRLAEQCDVQTGQ